MPENKAKFSTFTKKTIDFEIKKTDLAKKSLI